MTTYPEVLDRVPIDLIPCHIAAAGRNGSHCFNILWIGDARDLVAQMLALRSRGLRSSLTTLHLQDADEVRLLLGYPTRQRKSRSFQSVGTPAPTSRRSSAQPQDM